MQEPMEKAPEKTEPEVCPYCGQIDDHDENCWQDDWSEEELREAFGH